MIFDQLPDEVKCDILSYTDLCDYANVATVDKSWNLMLNDSVTWINKLKKSHIYAGSDILYYLLKDFKFMRNYYILNSKDNFLKNVNMDKGLEHWGPSSKQKESKKPQTCDWQSVTGGWKIETSVGCDPFPTEAGPAFNNAVTSYMSCCREQEIQLSRWLPNIGILMQDGYKVRVSWSVWVAPRYDCGSKFSACIESQGTEIELANVRLNAGRKWLKLTKSADLDISDGDCLFTYKESGQDTQFWNGHYGVKILNPAISVKIIPGAQSSREMFE